MVCPSPWRCVCRDHTLDSAFAPGTSEVAVGFVAFLYLVVDNLPPCTALHLFLVPYSFFVSVVRDVCPGAGPAAKGPGPSLSQRW